jgi:hypothetical protein
MTALALDVEFAHFKWTAKGQRSVAAWVAIVSEHGAVVLDSYCKAPELDRPEEGVQWMGGVTLPLVTTAPPLQCIATQIKELASSSGSTLIVGHGVRKVCNPCKVCNNQCNQPADCQNLLQADCQNLLHTSQDLLALGIQPEALGCPVFDLVTFRSFQRRNGAAHTLQWLAAKHLGVAIHAPNETHSAVQVRVSCSCSLQPCAAMP